MGFGLRRSARGAGEPGIAKRWFRHGSLMMNIQEMATASENQLDVKIILMNNEALGLVHQQQSRSYEQGRCHLSGKNQLYAISPPDSASKPYPNNEADPQAALQENHQLPLARAIDVRIDAEEKVYPLAPPGAANTEMVGE
ncbi:thiamine pyrophosphate-dependent enzyme [Escherichia coli]